MTAANEEDGEDIKELEVKVTEAAEKVWIETGCLVNGSNTALVRLLTITEFCSLECAFNPLQSLHLFNKLLQTSYLFE